MEIAPTEVFFKIRDDGCILDVNSRLFLQSLEGWTKADEGYSDKYVHAQGNYFPGPIVNEKGIPNYMYKPDGDKPYIERTQEEKADELAALPLPPLSETTLLKAQVQALTERSEFLEDVVAELAMMVL